MSRFIHSPNLPEGKISTVICGSDDKDVLEFFRKNGIDVVRNFANPYIDPCVSTHADMSAIYLGEGLVLLDKNQTQLKNVLVESGCTVVETDEEIKGEYPGDVKLNFAVAGKSIIGSFRFADGELIRLTEKMNRIDTKQGYSKCSVLTVSENAIITDDVSIYRKALENGFESLLVAKGDIHLEGHSYGFIGGASAKISRDTVLFFGNIEKHRDFVKIRDFLYEHGCNYLCTDNKMLRDIGGIVSLKEKTEKS